MYRCCEPRFDETDSMRHAIAQASISCVHSAYPRVNQAKKQIKFLPLKRDSSLDEPRTHERVNVCSLHLHAVGAVHFFQEDSQNLDRRLQAQDVGALPALQSRNADTWLLQNR